MKTFISLLFISFVLLGGTTKINQQSSNLPAKNAKINGKGAKFHSNCIGYYSDVKTTVEWEINVTEAGDYILQIQQAVPKALSGSTYKVVINKQTFTGVMKQTKSWAHYHNIELGEVNFSRTGIYKVKFIPIKIKPPHLGNIKSMHLQKIAPKKPARPKDNYIYI